MEAVLTLKNRTVTTPKHGGFIVNDLGHIVIDLSQPRSFLVRGIDQHGNAKDYLLRVSESGKLSLV